MKASVDFPECDEVAEKARLLILSVIPTSNITTKPKGSNEKEILSTSSSAVVSPNKRGRKIFRTNNRKQITTEGSFTHAGKKYSINNGGERGLPLYIETLQKIIEQFEIGLEKWRRVLVLRVELHMPHETKTNKVISLFLKRLFKRLRRHYGFKEIGYAWAREL